LADVALTALAPNRNGRVDMVLLAVVDGAGPLGTSGTTRAQSGRRRSLS
jgi:hypothetical protein